MRSPIDRNDDRPVAIPLATRPGIAPWKIAAGLIALVSLGLLGRLVPPPAPAARESAALTTAAPTPDQVVRLASPFADVLYVRTTEIEVRGTAPAGMRQVEVAVIVLGQAIGEERIAVDARGRFEGLVSIIPPAARSVGLLEVREPGSGGRLLADLSFALQAGALILPWEPSKLLGEAGSTMVVDVLVYGPVSEVRGLLTTVDGKLIATGSALVGPPRKGTSGPWTIAVSIEIPPDRLPDRARLHVMAFDQAGAEMEHLDANVALANG